MFDNHELEKYEIVSAEGDVGLTAEVYRVRRIADDQFYFISEVVLKGKEEQVAETTLYFSFIGDVVVAPYRVNRSHPAVKAIWEIAERIYQETDWADHYDGQRQSSDMALMEYASLDRWKEIGRSDNLIVRLHDLGDGYGILWSDCSPNWSEWGLVLLPLKVIGGAAVAPGCAVILDLPE